MREILRERYETWVRDLEAFGHRGSATANEERAADYLVEQLGDLGIKAVKQPFIGLRSAGLRVLIHVAVAGVGAALLWSVPWLTVALGLLAFASLITEFLSRGRILGRLLPEGTSHNVVARLRAGSGTPQRRLVVCGHYDTQRTGWIWSEAVVRRLAPVLRTSPGPMKSPLFPVAAATALLPIVGLLQALDIASGLMSVLGVLMLVIYAVAGVVVGQWSVGPFVPGASDNATGAAAVLAIGAAWRDLLSEAKTDVELVLLATGCEEVGLMGAAGCSPSTTTATCPTTT